MKQKIKISTAAGNMTPIIREAIENAENDTVLSFENAEYHFFAEGCYTG